MKITEIEIKRLYGTYSYHITDLDKQNLLVLTGYNGMGKTTILNIIDAVSNLNLWFFYELEFDEISIRFVDGLNLRLSKSQSAPIGFSPSDNNTTDENIKTAKDYRLEWFRSDQLLGMINIDLHNLFKATSIVCKAEYLSENGTDWIPLMNGNAKDIATYLFRKKNVPSFAMLHSSVTTLMIQAQRVKQIVKVVDDDERFLPFESLDYEEIDTIDVVAKNLGKLLDEKRIEFLSSIQKSKNALMDRLLDADIQDLGADAYAKLAAEAQAEIDDLSMFGIAYEKVREYNPNNGKLLSAYLLDLKDTLDRYAGLLHDLKLFASILSEKQMLHKSLRFSPSYGLKVFNDKGVSIRLSSLSSGEQNVIILLYKIIFEVQDGDILLIDEPEISMHVVWLKEFVKDVKRIAHDKSIQIVLATHSPQIVRGAIEYCFDLEMNNYEK